MSSCVRNFILGVWKLLSSRKFQKKWLTDYAGLVDQSVTTWITRYFFNSTIYDAVYEHSPRYYQVIIMIKMISSIFDLNIIKNVHARTWWEIIAK